MAGKTYAPDTVIQEMIRITIQRLAAKQRHPYVSKKKILKILFQVKEQLPDGNHVKDRLAYYWYKEGPYSEPIDANIRHLVSDKKIKKRSDRGATYEYDESTKMIPLMPHDDDMDEAGRRIGDAARRFVNIDDAVQDIYDNAPFEWYGAYNTEFKNKLEIYCKSVLNKRENSSLTDDDMQVALDNAVLKYPPLPKFIEHRRIFMDFAKMLDAFLNSEARRKNAHTLPVLRELSDKIWDTFASGVRVEHHDGHYNDRVDDWKRMYERQLGDLEVEIREKISQFEAIVADNRRFSPEIEDLILHPENHDFRPLQPNAVSNPV